MEYKNNQLTLSEIKIGKSAIIVKVNAVGGMRRRLQDLGFITGNSVDALSIAALGDPTAYRIHGTVIALRKEDADQILVEEL